MNDIREILNDFDKAIDSMEQMLKEGTLTNESELAMHYTMRGGAYFQMAMLDEAISDFDKAIVIFDRLIQQGKTPPKEAIIQAYSFRGMGYQSVGEHEAALSDLTMTISIMEDLKNQGHQLDEYFLSNIYIFRGGCLNRMVTQPDNAISDYSKALKIKENLKSSGYEIDESDIATILMGIAQSYDQKKQFEESNKAYTKCIDIWEAMLKYSDSFTEINSLAIAYMNRSANYTELKQNDLALADINRCIELTEKMIQEGLEDDLYYLVSPYFNRAQCHKHDNNLHLAVNDYISALRIHKSMFSENPDFQEMYYDTLSSYLHLLEHLDENDRLSEAIEEFLFPLQNEEKTVEASALEQEMINKYENNDARGNRVLKTKISDTVENEWKEVPSLDFLVKNLTKTTSE